ncbi:uncharacterized protein YALI1_E32931g [Yarrowia lipolytica]|uniref:Uncharacterized protein n=1 Tax=Yarrowia lipolytica TaxID=4952 RepID=A0A1D8NK98_YARLL|nr:hypothetical protein YALI1_E32931g [Yarrowia lipolytica]
MNELLTALSPRTKCTIAKDRHMETRFGTARTARRIDTQRLTVATSTQPNCACHDDTSLSLCGNACDCQSHLFVHTTPPYIHHIEC